jgi:uncharacterized membrane protein YphA (DoxX/SURF4 family)
MNKKRKINIKPLLILKIALSGYFIYSGLSILTTPIRWIDKIPNFLNFFNPKTFLIICGIINIIIGLFILFGILTSLFSFLAFLIILTIMIFVGVNDTNFQNFSLALTSLAIFIMNFNEK